MGNTCLYGKRNEEKQWNKNLFYHNGFIVKLIYYDGKGKWVFEIYFIQRVVLLFYEKFVEKIKPPQRTVFDLWFRWMDCYIFIIFLNSFWIEVFGPFVFSVIPSIIHFGEILFLFKIFLFIFAARKIISFSNNLIMLSLDFLE